MVVPDILGGFSSTTEPCKPLEKTCFALLDHLTLLLYCMGYQPGGRFVRQERNFYRGFV